MVFLGFLVMLLIYLLFWDIADAICGLLPADWNSVRNGADTPDLSALNIHCVVFRVETTTRLKENSDPLKFLLKAHEEMQNLWDNN